MCKKESDFWGTSSTTAVFSRAAEKLLRNCKSRDSPTVSNYHFDGE